MDQEERKELGPENFEYRPDPGQPEKKNRHGMLTGILVGAVCSAVLVSLLFLGYLASVRGDTRGLSPNSSHKTSISDIQVDLLDETTLEKLEDIEDFIDRYYLYEEDEQAMRDGMLSGLVDALDDDYAYYYNEEEYQALMESNSGTYCGIGVQVSQDMETYTITVTKVFRGSPALEAGILPGDVLVCVDDMSVEGVDLNTVVTYIRGEEGTTVDLTFYRADTEKMLDFTVERHMIDSPSVEYEMLDGGIGYIQLTEFAENTYDQYMEAINALKKAGMKGLLVDVRNNPGGMLDSVVSVLDEMLPEGTIVTVRDKNGNEEVYTSDAAQAVSVPMVVLVNGNSASAAEIYTAALQDYGVATIVGTQTFGKGIVQTIITLSDRKSALKITTARYYTPNDVCIHEIGVTPDVIVELNEGLETKPVLEKEEDNQLQEAIAILQKEIGE